ncbi:hypothetical protein [Spiroplasma apis]|uniref:Uncharacterized protein n=1 Tax=Spiroplasma apis B31 TaxID=1276258 RepID=V5RJD8_SPIAP|nr:hypothetical protein [Spiroplasma apis]AHB36674.1 hypothetical protein SAPIS_v1c08290 [Spiroplasma apis B31]
MYYLDFDYRVLYIYKDGQLLHKEPTYCLYNLKSLELIAMGEEARHKLKCDINFLVYIPIENSKIVSEKLLNDYISFILRKYSINESEVKLIIYKYINKFKNYPSISGKNFLQKFSSSDYFFEIRGTESVLYDKQKKQLKVITWGLQDIYKNINYYLNDNYNVTLNTSKIESLIRETKNDISPLNIVARSILNGQEVDIEISNISELFKSSIKKLQNFIKKIDASKISFGPKFIEVFDFVY